MKKHAILINESGLDILYIDFSGLKGPAFLRAIEQVQDIILALPGHENHPSITNLRGAHINQEVREAMKNMAKEIKSKKNHSGRGISKVVIGLSSLEKLVARAITPDILYLDSREEAIQMILKRGK
jgi:hypothetical protein